MYVPRQFKMHSDNVSATITYLDEPSLCLVNRVLIWNI